MFPKDANSDDNVPSQDSQPAPGTPVIAAEQLFAGQREVWIELDGIRYRLRITRRNRLILQK